MPSNGADLARDACIKQLTERSFCIEQHKFVREMWWTYCAKPEHQTRPIYRTFTMTLMAPRMASCSGVMLAASLLLLTGTTKNGTDDAARGTHSARCSTTNSRCSSAATNCERMWAKSAGNVSTRAVRNA